MIDAIEVKTQIVRGMGYFNRQCELCGMGYETNALAVEINGLPDEDAIAVCPECVKAGQAGTSQRMLEHAERLEKYAQWLRGAAPIVASISGKGWVTAEQFKAAIGEFEA